MPRATWSRNRPAKANASARAPIGAAVLRRTTTVPAVLTPSTIHRLQRAVGNQAVGQLLARGAQPQDSHVLQPAYVPRLPGQAVVQRRTYAYLPHVAEFRAAAPDRAKGNYALVKRRLSDARLALERYYEAASADRPGLLGALTGALGLLKAACQAHTRPDKNKGDAERQTNSRELLAGIAIEEARIAELDEQSRAAAAEGGVRARAGRVQEDPARLLEVLNDPDAFKTYRAVLIDRIVGGDSMSAAVYAVKTKYEDGTRRPADKLARIRTYLVDSELSADDADEVVNTLRGGLDGGLRMAAVKLHQLDTPDRFSGVNACAAAARILSEWIPDYKFHEAGDKRHYFVKNGDTIVDGTWKQMVPDDDRNGAWAAQNPIFVGSIDDLKTRLRESSTMSNEEVNALVRHVWEVAKQVIG